MSLKDGQLYEFGPFRLEPEEQLLVRNGKPTLLTPKAFNLLVLLVQNQGRLVTKDQIMQAVWPGSFVEEANITVLISSLRKALGETKGDAPYITTVPKKGYRFAAYVKVVPHTVLAPISELTPEPSVALPDRQNGDFDYSGPASRLFGVPAMLRNRNALAGLALLTCLLVIPLYIAHRRSLSHRNLAVLPLRNLRNDPDSGFLSFSLADAVITKLGTLSSITVRPSSAVEKYKGKEVDLRRVAADLNVDTVLTGSFIRDGPRLRITYQLVDVNTYKILCKDVIDLNYNELLAIHDNVSTQIIAALQLNLSPPEAERIKADTPAKPLAYEYYLRGVDLMGSHNFSMAVKMLEKSAEIDPTYPLTWAYLGQSYTSDATFELGGREQYRRAQAAYQRALTLQPKQLEAEVFLANLLIDTGRVEQAVPLLRDALRASPNNAAVHWELGYAYRFAGMLEQSLQECLRSRQIDPAVKTNGAALNTYLYLGQYENFLGSLPDVNEAAFFRFYRGFGEYHLGKLDSATEDFTRAYRDDPTLYTGIGQAFADAIQGKNSEGLRLLQELESKIQQRGVGDPEATYKMAQAYAVLGDKTSAMRAFRSTIEAGFFSYPYFVQDPLLDRVRSLPEFPQIVGLARRRHEAFKKEFF